MDIEVKNPNRRNLCSDVKMRVGFPRSSVWCVSLDYGRRENESLTATRPGVDCSTSDGIFWALVFLDLEKGNILPLV